MKGGFHHGNHTHHAAAHRQRKSQQDIANIHQWAGTIRQYLDLQELNREIIEELIDRIEIGERTVIDGQRHQDIKIYTALLGWCDRAKKAPDRISSQTKTFCNSSDI